MRGESKGARRRGLGAALATAAVLLAVLGASAGLLWYRFSASGHNPKSGAPATKAPAPPNAAVPRLVPAAPPADPFAGSPAESYADGAAGIVVPAAHPVGGYPAAQVAAAYQMTKALLIAAQLDPQTLRGGSPAAFARLLVSQQRADFFGRLNKAGVDKQGFVLSTRAWVTSFAPGTTQLIGKVIKVHGWMTARAATENGNQVLRIHLDYLFVTRCSPQRSLPAGCGS